MNNKAFYRTLEVLVAIVLTFLFVSYFIPRFTPTEIPEKPNLNVLPRLEDNDAFRNCAVGGDESCMETYVSQVIPSGYGYETSVSNDVSYEETGLPSAKDIYIESIFLSGNITVYNPVIVKLYHWRK